MFGNKLYYPKLIAAFGLFLACCAVSYAQGRWINPDPVTAELRTPRHDGETLWVPAARISRMEPDGFTFDYSGKEIRVRGKREWMKKGDVIELTGTFSSHPPTLQLESARKNRLPWWRSLVNPVSLLILAWVLIVFLRRFRIQRKAWEVRWPTS